MHEIKTTHLLDNSIRIKKLDKIIGEIRIAIAIFIIIVEYLAGNSNIFYITIYLLLLGYSTLWLLFQTRNPNQSLGRIGYFNFITDLALMAIMSYFSLKNTISYFDVLYIILALVYLIRFGKKVSIVFAAVVTIQILYICLYQHFIHSTLHFVLLGTIFIIIYFVGNILEVESNLRKKLKYISTHDELTGVHNYRYFQELLNVEVERSNRYQSSLSMIILDIDNFKNYNDSFGHDAGNEVLKVTASLLKDTTRDIDFIARYGGEEFIILMPETDKRGAITLAERVRRVIADYNFPNRKVTVSLGIASIPKDANTRKELFLLADQQLYKAKSDGKNCFKYLH
ncbi:MAG: GGDEF domain-containing protein [Firmicutes bacterium]|nr:GGDEF domain-containing protein [Bacillota bacterium]